MGRGWERRSGEGWEREWWGGEVRGGVELGIGGGEERGGEGEGLIEVCGYYEIHTYIHIYVCMYAEKC